MLQKSSRQHSGSGLPVCFAKKVAGIAIACNPAFIADARFFENIVVSRGLILGMFTDTESARSWLMGIK